MRERRKKIKDKGPTKKTKSHDNLTHNSKRKREDDSCGDDDGQDGDNNHHNHGNNTRRFEGSHAEQANTDNRQHINGNTTSNNWKAAQKDMSITVTIPSTLNAKIAKKIRKDARRKARKDGRDESLLIFVDEKGDPIITAIHDDSENHDDNRDNDHKEGNLQHERDNLEHTHKKRKINKSFPNINQILANVALVQKEQDEKQKRQSYEDSIPADVKAKYVALDCEMVGIGAEGKQSALARVSITDWFGNVILDTFVQVPDRVTDFRTFVSGVRAKDIKITSSNSMELHACRKKVGEIMKDKILIGHSLKNDFAALMLGHPKHLIRDTARYKPFMRASGRNGGKLRPRKLRDLVKEHVGLVIQKEGDAHTSVEDAKATMELYKSVREQWERELDKLEATKTKKKR